VNLLRTIALALVLCAATAFAAEPRREWSLNDAWRTTMDESNRARFNGFEQPTFDNSDSTVWRTVSVPHNWDDYAGVRRLVHGNLHGYAWYRRTFDVPATERDRRVFLFFEGVGSYATVWVNGQLAGKHAGGRTTFTLDVTALVRFDAPNVLAVRADHPAGITDLPWICGGCSPKEGFSEGSQPLGIFRPVTLYTTSDVRVEPFGVHVWNDGDATEKTAIVHFTTELRNYGEARNLTVVTRMINGGDLIVAEESKTVALTAGVTGLKSFFRVSNVALWSLESPTLYTLVTEIRDRDRVLDRVETPFGIRTIHWPAPDAPLPAPFRLNGKPVFINGTCEYEHNLGASHAFTPEQIAARVRQIRAAGFNAFRDAHQPHNLRYHPYWDREGVLWWTQMAAQVWFDTPEFRANFKQLLREWVRERRNSPSLVLWGLANESKLPTDFAAECVAIIRELDPTTSSQRIVTTCNAGTGTDWNVPQNWSGTYGGKPEEYAEDLKRQRLIGEYGAWRSLGLHSEGGFQMDGIRSESRHDALMAQKIRLAESVRDQVPGHFHWLFVTHENPGRAIGSKGQQGGDGWAELDRLGPANNKGLLTLWGEPTDAFFLYRASYAAKTDPMVHVVSHTWPDRWDAPGVKRGLEVYSNCDEVELFNGAGTRSLGVRKQGGPGVPFRWDDVEITTNVLYAEGRVGGKTVARDAIYLKNLPPVPATEHAALVGPEAVSVLGEANWNYLYRVNCGGPDLVDSHGQTWFADRDLSPGDPWGSRSWAADYPTLPPRFGSQREFYEPVRGTRDEALFHTYRYGREKLRYEFAVPNGDYRVELYFVEPWYGRGGGDATRWRLFDVALNGTTALRDVDLWSEAGYAHAVKKIVNARARDGRLVISFPRVASYQAVVSAIAIATRDFSLQPVGAVAPNGPQPIARALAATDESLPATAQTYPAVAATRQGNELSWSVGLGLGGAHDFALRYTNAGDSRDIEFRIVATDGSLIDHRLLRLARTVEPREIRIDGVGMNAGDYTVVISPISDPISIESLRTN
jgi:beta-galactosidase